MVSCVNCLDSKWSDFLWSNAAPGVTPAESGTVSANCTGMEKANGDLFDWPELLWRIIPRVYAFLPCKGIPANNSAIDSECTEYI
jgi:hypothetical protein